jgi:hypothetical protein
MRLRKLPFQITILLLLLLALPGAVVHAQEADEWYCPQTGHYVTGQFLTFYHSTPENLRLFGYPITEAFTDNDGHMVQYFQRIRMDLIDGNIQVAPLGKLLYDTGAPLAPVSTNSAMCRRFPETGKSVCYAFLQFYDKYNGALYFGNPISDLEERDGGRFVQYFENVRMEWHPNAAEGEKVVLTHLGRMYFDDYVNNPALTRWISAGSDIINTPFEMQAHAFVKDALLPANASQTLYLIVQDSQFAPVEGVNLLVTLHYPDGTVKDARPSPTDENGISEFVFPVTNHFEVDELVQVDVQAVYNGSSTTTTTWFRIWW